MTIASALSGHTVIALHAHPDDESIFTGIALRRLADAGARVVLVLGTAGDLGESRIALHHDETVPQRRIAELERAADLLGVARLVLLGRRDSGLPGWSSTSHARALAVAPPLLLARCLAELANAEGAGTFLYDDQDGIYGHPDHSAMFRIGSTAAGMVGATAYRTTVDRPHLDSRPDRHLVLGAADAAGVGFGRPSREITLSVTATSLELATKRAAILAHESQVSSDAVPADQFAATYGREWFCRSGPPGVLDLLAGDVEGEPDQAV